jgi:hypothetical protein
VLKTGPPTSSNTSEPPSISKLSAKKGPTSGGTTVFINGRYLLYTEQVTFGGVPASFTVLNETNVEAVSPPSAGGRRYITVTTAGGSTPLLKGDLFKYGNPEITHISPASGPLAGGTVVTIEGAGFEPGAASTFVFKSAPATSVWCESTTVCTAISPPGMKPAGVNIRTTIGGARSAKGPGNLFTYE